jgi:hypothetical protein
MNFERRASFVALDSRAHLLQRLGHSLHRPASQRSVAVESRDERAAGENTGEEPHGRAGIPAVDDLFRRAETFPALAIDQEQTIITADFHAERPERLDRAVVILAA